MSPLDTKGGFHLHPGAANMHDAAPKAPPKAPPIAKPKPDPGKQEGDHGHVELHKAEGGGYKTVHQPSGEEKQHPTLHAAHHAMNEHMGEDGCSDSSCAEHGGGGEAAEAPMAGGGDEDY